MKNSSLLVFGFVLLIQLCACSQDKKPDCETILKQQPYIVREVNHQSTMHLDSVNNDFYILRECGNLDSVDSTIFQGPVLGQLIIMELNEDEKIDNITYQVLLDLISKFKKNQQGMYQQLRTGISARLELEKMKVDLSKFESLRSKFNTAGLTNSETDAFKAFLVKNKKNWTYKQAMEAFVGAEKTTVKSKSPLDFPKLETLDKGLLEAKTAQKNCLIYFTGWGCVNSRKFEEQLLKDSEIQQMIRTHFVYKAAFVDERQKLPGETKTIGEKHIELQKEKFNSTSQPMLYILSPDGKLIASWSYEDGPDTFKSFLEKGIGE